MRRRYRNNKNDSLSVSTILLLLLIITIVSLFYLFLDYAFENIEEVIKILVVLAAVVVFIIVILKISVVHRNKQIKFIYEHSIAVKELVKINKKYVFLPVKNFDYNFNNDNENYFDLITPKDYLVYRLQFEQKNVKSAIIDANNNADKYDEYIKEVKGITELNRYDTNKYPIFKSSLLKREKKILKNLVLHPTIEFSIFVRLILTNVNNYYKGEKGNVFVASEILKIIDDMSDKSGVYYNNEEIWQSICRIERAKVTNKLRFFVYDRDGHRCVKCGSTYNLEVDHIFPISKGGKSTPDNLQTLCHNCNSLKSNTIEYGAVDPKVKRIHENAICPWCGAPTVVRSGKRGKFLACSNYPNCKYTKSI